MQQQLFLLTCFIVLIVLLNLLQRLYRKLHRKKTCTNNSRNPGPKLNLLEATIANVRDPSYLLEYDPEVEYRPPPKIDWSKVRYVDCNKKS